MEPAEESKTAFFVFEPGRYYVAMWFMNIPKHVTKFGKGGDICALLWRLEAELDTWHLTYRFRHYAAGSDPWDGKDHFSGYEMVIKTTEKDVEKGVRPWLEQCCQLAGQVPKVEMLAVRGDHAAFHAAVQREKPYWMHCQQVLSA